MLSLPQDPGKYFSALGHLRSLTLYNTRVEHLTKQGFHTLFSPFREILTFLSLDTCATSFSAFVTLIDYFPNISTLQLCSVALEQDEGSVPSLSRPLRGKIRVLDVRTNWLGFLDRFSKLDLEYEELVIDPSLAPIDAEFLERALRISANTVKSLRLTEDLQRK